MSSALPDVETPLRAWRERRATARRAAHPEMRAVCLAAVRMFYANWRAARLHTPRVREPSLTTAALRGYLAQAGSVEGVPVPRAFHEEGYHFQIAMVRSALEALVRTGDLETSIGAGVHGEARMYSPTAG